MKRAIGIAVDTTKLEHGILNKGYSRRELAKQTGLSPLTVLRAVKGGRITPPTIKKLADALDMTPVELVEG